MVVVIANDLPAAVRGRMKLWFIEPKPNVFVSGIKDSTADFVVSYLLEKCPSDSGLLVFKKSRSAPGYSVYGSGPMSRKLIKISGLTLVIEKEKSVEKKNK